MSEIPFDRLKIFGEVERYAEQHKNVNEFEVYPLVYYTDNGPEPNYRYKRFLVRVRALDEWKLNFDREVAFSRRWDLGDADVGELKIIRDLIEATSYAQIVAAYLAATTKSHTDERINVKLIVPEILRDQKFYSATFEDFKAKF